MITEITGYIMYEKSPQLLASMAMRASHDFGLKEPEQRQLAMNEMEKLYDLYKSGKTNEQINEELKWGLVTLSQIREEVDGKGFFNPERFK